jgi:hypothetical protein
VIAQVVAVLAHVIFSSLEVVSMQHFPCQFLGLKDSLSCSHLMSRRSIHEVRSFLVVRILPLLALDRGVLVPRLASFSMQTSIDDTFPCRRTSNWRKTTMKTEIDQTLIGPSPTSVRDAPHSAASYFPADLSLRGTRSHPICPAYVEKTALSAGSLACLLQHPWLDDVHFCCLLKARLVAKWPGRPGPHSMSGGPALHKHDRTLWRRVCELHVSGRSITQYLDSLNTQ